MNFKKIVAFTTSLLVCCGSVATPQVADMVSNSIVAVTQDDSTSTDNSIIWGKDNWSFNNSMNSFGNDSYYISDDYYNVLTSNLSDTEKEKIDNSKNGIWTGSCYGLSVLTILAKVGMFDVSQFQEGAECLNDINSPNNDDIESLINYYQFLQYTDTIQKKVVEYINKAEEEKLNELITLSSQVKDGGTPVLLSFHGKFYGTTDGGAATIAYGVEYGTWTIDGVTYDGRILTYDVNCTDFDEDYCMYFNTSANEWIIPAYELTSTNNGKIGLITNDLDLIKNHGCIDGGSCGENCKYSLNRVTGTLTISGAGDMDNYSEMIHSPFCWIEDKDNDVSYSNTRNVNKIIIEDGVTSIGSCAFSYFEDLTNISIPNSVTSIGGGAFSGCSSLTNIVIPNSVISIVDNAFDECDSLTEITLSNGITSIGEAAFYGCDSLTEITLPNGITSIGSNAFRDCKKLTNITIPDGVTSIGYGAFYGCTNLTDVYFKGTEDEWNAIEIDNYNATLTNATIHYVGEEPTASDDSGSCGSKCTYNFDSSTGTLTISGTGAMDSYFNDSDAPWYDYRESIKTVVIENGITSIGYNAFASCTALTDITIPDSVSVISEWAFSNCKVLTNVIIPDGVTTIDYGIFSGCKKLKEVTIPNSVTSIGSYAFYNCSVLTDIYFEGSKTEWDSVLINSNNEVLSNVTIHCSNQDITPPETTPPTTTTTEETTTTTEPVTTTTEETTTTTEPVTTTTEETTTTTEEPVQSEDKTLIWGKDNWNFNNVNNYFGMSSNGFYISDSDYKTLLSKLDNTEKEKVISYKNKNWAGSCYGMSLTALLAKENIFNVNDWDNSATCLNELPSLNPKTDTKEESLINYYQMLQKTNYIEQLITDTQKRSEFDKVSELLDLVSQVKDGGSPVLVCYQRKNWGAHAVVAYGVENISEVIDGMAYQKKILILDPNAEPTSNQSTLDSYCIYVNTENGSWYIPGYNLNSQNYAQFIILSNDLSILNNYGYFEDDFDEMPNIDSSKFNGILEFSNTDSDNFAISKLTYTSDGYISSPQEENDIEIFYNLGSSSTTGENLISNAILKDAYSGYSFKTKDEGSKLNLSLTYEDSLLTANASNGTQVDFAPEGYVNLYANNSDYQVGMTFNNDFCTLPWYTVTAEAPKANSVKMTKVDDGIVLYSDNLVNVTVSAHNDEVSPSVNFSTTSSQVLIYEIDEDTIGIAVDEDEDGSYEKTIAQSEIGDSDNEISIGDVSSDNTVNVMDLLMLKKYVLKIFTDSDINMSNADLNQDGNVNVMDLLLLKKVVLKIMTLDDIKNM